MDNIIKVRRSFLNEIRGLLNSFRSVCDTCYRSSCDCSASNELTRAKELIVKIDGIRDAEEERFYVANPAEEYMARILKAIRQGGGKPVRSQSIVIPGESRQRKARALKILLRRGEIVRKDMNGEPFYVIADDDAENNTNKGEKRYGV